jgi:MFS superfamily sulfate permease-like transporter
MTNTSLSRDLASSLVVFLVAMPLCLGIAVASGVPVAMGIVSGIVGGIIVGLLAGSPLQVSGPAAGLAVIVFSFVQQYGVAMLGPVLVAAGLLQILAGFLKIGSWFRAISPAVVHGMLAGIGILIILGQIHVVMGAEPAAGGLENVAAIDNSIGTLWRGDANALIALGVGVASLLAMVAWEKFRPKALALVPGALIGVGLGTVLAVILHLPIVRVEVPDTLLQGLSFPNIQDFVQLAQPGVMITVLVIAVIASAETLLSAAAVDRMHDGKRTHFNKELFAQGVGNGICGMLGALPITGVIVRSSANIQAGARTRLSTILHGVWILALVAMFPQLLGMVPLTALAAVLLVTGWRLISLHHVRHLFDHHGWIPVGIWVATVSLVVIQDLLIGVATGLVLSVMEILPYLRQRLHIREEDKDHAISLMLKGAGTYKDVPRLLNTLEGLPKDKMVEIVCVDLQFLDHTCTETISEWLRRERRSGRQLAMMNTPAGHHPRLIPHFKRFSAEVA